MSNIIAKQYTKQGNVLFHPHFDRPKVQQPKRTGRFPKGVISLRTWAFRRQCAETTHGNGEATILKRHQSLTDWGVTVMRTDYETAFHMASAALAKYKEMSNGLQASK